MHCCSRTWAEESKKISYLSRLVNEPEHPIPLDRLSPLLAKCGGSVTCLDFSRLLNPDDRHKLTAAQVAKLVNLCHASVCVVLFDTPNATSQNYCEEIAVKDEDLAEMVHDPKHPIPIHGLSPLLLKCGRYVTHMDFSRLLTVEDRSKLTGSQLTTIVRLCPQLRSLTLSDLPNLTEPENSEILSILASR